MQATKGVAIQLDAETRPRRHRDLAVFDAQLAAFDDVIDLPRVMRIAGVGELRHRGRDVDHGRKRDPEV